MGLVLGLPFHLHAAVPKYHWRDKRPILYERQHSSLFFFFLFSEISVSIFFLSHPTQHFGAPMGSELVLSEGKLQLHFQLYEKQPLHAKAWLSPAPSIPQHRAWAPHHPPAVCLFTAVFLFLKIWSQGAKSLLCVEPVLTGAFIVFCRLQAAWNNRGVRKSRHISIFGPW